MNIYKTKDLSLASMLCSFDCQLVDYTIDEKNQLWFYFENSELVQRLSKQFYLNTATVNLTRFTAAQKMLKTLIYRNKEVNNETYRSKSSRRTANEYSVA